MDESKSDRDRRSSYSNVTDVQRFSMLQDLFEGTKKVPLKNIEAIIGDTQDFYIPPSSMSDYEEAGDLIKILLDNLDTRIEIIHTIAKHRGYVISHDPDYFPSDPLRFPRTQMDVEHAVFLDDKGNVIEINRRFMKELKLIRLELEVGKTAPIVFASRSDLKSEAGRPPDVPRQVTNSQTAPPAHKQGAPGHV